MLKVLKINKMKKQFRYLSFLLLVMGFVSCEADDETDLPTENVEGYVHLRDRKISTLDQNEELKLSLFTNNGVQIQSITIEDEDGNVIATPTISGDTLATFNSSTLGDLSESIDVRVVSILSNGKIANDFAAIKVYDAVKLGGDNPTSFSIDSLASASTALSYDISTFRASVDKVDLFLKKNSKGTYMNTNHDLSTEEGTVVLNSTNYETLNLAVNDTLFYKFAASSGSVTKETEGNIIIKD